MQEQPLIVVVGEQYIDACYVYVNNIKYQLSSPLQAVDIAVKSFYSFQLEYPKEAAYPWIVIQRLIYNIKGETDEQLPCVNTYLGFKKVFKIIYILQCYFVFYVKMNLG